MTIRREYQPDEIIPGTIYKVVHLLGAGGMGTVYDVEDTTIGKRYVVKTLHSELGDRKDLARRMQAEARTLARLHHPNIVEVITAGVTQDDRKLPYYVMEKLNGQSLRVVMDKKGSIDLPHAIHVAIDLLDALDHAHDKGVIHRDVKPENIFLHRTMNGVTVTKLLDFGVMALLDNGRGETGGRFLGTLRYAAPEQLRGAKATPKIDLYAAGLVIFEIIAGRGPFDDEVESQQVMSARLSQVAPLLSSRAPVKVPPELDALVRAALSHDPEHRPKDAFSFSAALRNLKRLTGGSAGGFENTEHRATQAALLGVSDVQSARPAVVVLNQAAPPGQQVLVAPAAPAAQDHRAYAPTQAQVEGPARAGIKTTMLGMPAPSVTGRTLENAPPSATTQGPLRPQPAQAAQVGPYVDRAAATGSLLIDTPRGPRHGTEPVIVPPVAPTLIESPGAYPPTSVPGSFGPPVTLPAAQGHLTAGGRTPTQRSPSVAPLSQGGGQPHFQWPVERGNEGSDSAQVHSVPAGATRPRQPPRRGVAVVIFAAAVTVGAAGAGVYFLTRPAPAASPASAPPPTEPAKNDGQRPLLDFPAPTLPVPAYPPALSTSATSATSTAAAVIEPAPASEASASPSTTASASVARHLVAPPPVHRGAPANTTAPPATTHAAVPAVTAPPPPPAKTGGNVGPGFE